MARRNVRYRHVATVAGNHQPSAEILGAPASAFVGDTAQLTLRKHLPDGTTDDTGGAVTWASSNRTAIAVSVAGLLSFLAGGTSTITATVDGQTYSKTVVSVPSEAVAWQQSILGSRLLALFSAWDLGASTVAGGVASQINDSHGAWSPMVPAPAAAGLLVTGSDRMTRTFSSTDGHAMQTALTNYTGAMTLLEVIIPKVGTATSDAGNFVFPSGIENSDASQGMKFSMKPSNSVPVHDPAHIGATFWPPGAEGGTRRLQSAKLRLMGLARSADGLTARLLAPRGPSESPTSASPQAVTATSWRLVWGSHANGAFIFGGTYRAKILLSGFDLSTAELNAAIALVRTYHSNCVTGAPKSDNFEGDSESAGAIQADNFVKTWTTLVTEDPQFATWDDANIATSGANTGNVLARLTSDLLPLLTPDQTKQIVSLQVATNDLRLGTSADTVLANIWSEAATILASNPNAAIFVAECLPATATGFGSVLNQTQLDAAIADFNTKLNAQAVSHGCHVMPFTLDAPFNDHNGWQNATYSLDGLHWKLAGLLILAARYITTTAPYR